MKQATRQIAALAAALIALFILCRMTFSREYTASVRLYPYGQSSFSLDGARVELDNPQAARLDRVIFGPDRVSFSLHPIKRGETSAQIFDSEGNEVAFLMFRVGALGTVYDLQTGGFTGDNVMLAGTTLFWLLLSAIMLWHFFRAKGSSFYSLASVYYSGFSLFSLITGGLMLRVTFRHLFDPAGFSLYSALDAITRASIRFMTLTMPVMLVFAVALAISNLVLLRHEGYALQNVLGLAVSALLIAGEAAGLYIFTRDFMGSEFAGLVRSTLENSYATVFVYFECMLAGAVICAVTAARYRPRPDKDAIIILGCRFRKDGTLPPLLRGRVDRALKFFSEQKQAAGKQAVFIPSGGQGADEPMAEAEAMRRYLIDNGIPSESIFPEAGSKNTDQNMAFSKQIVDEVAPNGNVLFVTTNYHVFRSGICAARAGLDAVGIGGRTAWWYWPNAFLREAAGLLVRYWKQDTALLILLIVFFALMSMLL